jgi:hypothetical protein
LEDLAEFVSPGSAAEGFKGADAEGVYFFAQQS